MTTARNTVLIVDDSTTVRKYHRVLAEQAGWYVIEAENGMEALEKALNTKVDLALVDVNMPVMDGFTFLREMRSVDGLGNTPAVMISTEAQLIDREKAFSAGANHYLIKPAKPVEFNHILSVLEVGGEQ